MFESQILQVRQVKILDTIVSLSEVPSECYSGDPL